MKKIRRSILMFSFLVSIFTVSSFACGTCTVSSSSNDGRCKACVGDDGDSCVNAFRGFACNGNGAVL